MDCRRRYPEELLQLPFARRFAKHHRIVEINARYWPCFSVNLAVIAPCQSSYRRCRYIRYCAMKISSHNQRRFPRYRGRLTVEAMGGVCKRRRPSVSRPSGDQFFCSAFRFLELTKWVAYARSILSEDRATSRGVTVSINQINIRGPLTNRRGKRGNITMRVFKPTIAENSKRPKNTFVPCTIFCLATAFRRYSSNDRRVIPKILRITAGTAKKLLKRSEIRSDCEKPFAINFDLL